MLLGGRVVLMIAWVLLGFHRVLLSILAVLYSVGDWVVGGLEEGGGEHALGHRGEGWGGVVISRLQRVGYDVGDMVMVLEALTCNAAVYRE